MIAAIVLAAGEGTRFGRTKQIEVVRGVPLVQHVVDAAAGADLGEIVVVLGHDAERVRAALRLPPMARVAVNERYREGQSTSLACGLRSVADAAEAAIVLLADQPGITPAHVRLLARSFGETGRPAVRLRFGQAPGPALLARAIWPEILALTGDVGARALLDGRPDLVEEIHLDEDAPLDVDRPQDLERA